VIELSKEKVSPFDTEASNAVEQLPIVEPPPSHSAGGSKIVRRSGKYWFELKGQRCECGTLKELLSKGLPMLEQHQPGTLDRLHHIKPKTKRIVARDPRQLFDREHLAQKHAEKLNDEWWFGTNNSAPETEAWLERACECAGIGWGKEFKTSLNMDPSDVFALLEGVKPGPEQHH
jgi:hypothetical protein